MTVPQVTMHILCNAANPPRPVGVDLMDEKRNLVASASLDDLRSAVRRLADMEAVLVPTAGMVAVRSSLPEDALGALRKITAAEYEYTGEAHEAADAILVEFVRALGFAEIADEYQKVEPKWYR